MSWRFRKSFKIIPGVRLNLSRSGLSASFGGAPFTVNVGPHGVYRTLSLPGTGLSHRQKIGNTTGTHPTQDSPLLPAPNTDAIPSEPSVAPIVPIPVTVPPENSAGVQEIRSGSTELMTSESLRELKRVIQTTFEEHDDIESTLAVARQEAERASRRYNRWDRGVLFKKIFKNSFANRKVESETASAKVRELEEQLCLTTIATQIEISKEQAEPYFRMRDEFAALSGCATIWDKKSRKATDKLRERTIANESIERERVTFSLGSCDLLNWEQKVPHLGNATGGDLFLYPGFILYRAAKQAFSVIDFHDVTLSTGLVKFVEGEAVPKDSQVVGQTWAKANKDGSPDRRFAADGAISEQQQAALENFELQLTIRGPLPSPTSP